ncbi:MAG: SulP family inorganic anion transporter [Pseudorhodoplanes sp.]
MAVVPTPHQNAEKPTFTELFAPKLVTVLREGYHLRDLGADAIAGLTVAIVALPLSMAIAIGSGVTPDRGLYTAIVGGFLISLLSGSRFQIGGPAGAFIGLIAVIVERHGYDGLVLATAMAGAIMIVIGLLRLGTYIKYIPFPAIVGFTAGIAVIIASTQIKDFLGLDLAKEPAEFLPKLRALWGAVSSLQPATLALSALSVAVIVIVRRLRPHWPSFLIAVVIAAAVNAVLPLGAATIGSQFGGIPSSLPSPALPDFSLAKIQAVLPDAIAIALLGSIESLLSAVVADGMTGRRHRSNCELVAQGVGNIGSVLFGGICVTGTIARTATNIRAGSRGPISGMLHSAYLLLFIMIAAPLVSYIPLAALAAVLLVVAWNMAEKDEFWSLLRGSRSDAAVLLATFLLTVFYDLVTGIAVGVILGSLVFLHRMAEAVEIKGGPHLVAEDEADSEGARAPYDPAQSAREDVMVYRISGAFFFGAVARVNAVLDRIGTHPRVLVLDFSEVPLIDSTAAHSLTMFVAKLRRGGSRVEFAGVRPNVRNVLTASGLTEPDVVYSASAASAR